MAIGWLFRLTFELSDSELQVRIGTWTIRRVPYRDIREIELPKGAWVRWHVGVIERWVNFSADRCIIIRRRSRFLGMEKMMVINPPLREDFVSRLRTKMISSPTD
jgi:hypothetical protein